MFAGLIGVVGSGATLAEFIVHNVREIINAAYRLRRVAVDVLECFHSWLPVRIRTDEGMFFDEYTLIGAIR